MTTTTTTTTTTTKEDDGPKTAGSPAARPAHMSCDAFLEAAEAFALGVLDDAERLACARHLAEAGRHAGCVEAVVDAQMVTARLASALPGRPLRPGAWAAIEARLAESSAETARGRRLWELADWLVAATVVSLYLYGAPVTRTRPSSLEGEGEGRRPGHAMPSAAR